MTTVVVKVLEPTKRQKHPFLQQSSGKSKMDEAHDDFSGQESSQSLSFSAL